MRKELENFNFLEKLSIIHLYIKDQRKIEKLLKKKNLEKRIALNCTTVHDYDFNYDSTGNVISKVDGATTVMTYTYDALNRMSAFANAGRTTTTYKYNAATQRLVKSGTTTTTNCVWDGGQIAFETFYFYTILSATRQFLQGNMQHGMIYNGTFAPNILNSNGDAAATVTTFNLTTNNMLRGQYEAYGNTISDSNSNNPYGYRGYYTDSETGFYYLNARYYDPSTQRLTQEDTYWGDGTNLYAYCHANPLMFTDPSGHFGGQKLAVMENGGSISGGAYNPLITSTQNIKVGSRGDDVRRIQKLVGAAVDGVFGPQTKAAVQKYQRDHALDADGIVGPQTRACMNRDISSSGQSATEQDVDVFYGSGASGSTQSNGNLGQEILNVLSDTFGAQIKSSVTIPDDHPYFWGRDNILYYESGVNEVISATIGDDKPIIVYCETINPGFGITATTGALSTDYSFSLDKLYDITGAVDYGNGSLSLSQAFSIKEYGCLSLTVTNSYNITNNNRFDNYYTIEVNMLLVTGVTLAVVAGPAGIAAAGAALTKLAESLASQPSCVPGT